MIVATCAAMAAPNGTNSTSRSRVERMLDERELEMRVGARVAVARKMFPAGGDTFRLQAANDGGAQPRHVGGFLRQRAVADDRVLRIRMDVEHRRVVERDADRRELQSPARGQTARQAQDRRFGRASPSVATR